MSKVISKYLIVKNPTITYSENKLLIKLKLKLKNNDKKYNVKDLREHIAWALNEASFRAEPLKLSKGDFVISESNIRKINIQ